jgi:hypothetical protein
LTSRGSIVRQSVYASSHEPLAPVDRALLPEAIASAEEGLAIARRLNDPTLLHRAYVVLSLLYWQDGQVERSREMTENDLGIVDRLPTTRQKVDVLDGIAAARINDGRFVEGLEVAERAYAMAVDLSAHERMHTSFTLMWAAEALGKWDRAVEVLEWHASAAAAEPAVTCPNVRGGGPLGATLLVRRGAIDRALELVPVEESALKRNTFTDKALIDRYAALTGNHYFARVLADNILAQEDRLKWPDGLDALIEALAELGRDDQVEILLPALRDQAPGDARLAPLADRFEAELMLRHGRPSTEIRPLLERALAWFDERAMPFEAARTRETLARIANPAEGRALLESAIETYVQLGARPYADAASATLANLGA